DLDHVDAQLAQPLRQPGAVAVGDQPVEDLRAGDEDAGPRGHVQVGSASAGSGLTPSGVISEPNASADGVTSIGLPLARSCTLPLPSVRRSTPARCSGTC